MLGLCQPVVNIVWAQAYSKACARRALLGVQGGLDVRRGRTVVAWGGEVGSVVGEDGVDLVRDGVDQATQEVCGVRRATFSCSSTKANFEVRSMATRR